MAAHSRETARTPQDPSGWTGWTLSALLFAAIAPLGLLIAAVLHRADWHGQLHQQQQALALSAAPRFANPDSWRSEPAFQASLADLRFAHAYLLEADGARRWAAMHEREQPPAWAAVPPLQLRLTPELDLVLEAAAPPAAIQSSLRTQGQLRAFIALLLSLALAMVLQQFINRPWRALLSWVRQLERGQLLADPPSLRGLPGALSEPVAVIARRLRLSRDTLQQHGQLVRDSDASQSGSLQQQLRKLEQDHQRLQGVLSSRSQFISSMSHELRTPLTGIMGFAELLGKGDLSGEQQDYVQTIRKSAKSLLSVINDLLDYGRIEAGRLEIHEVGFDISDTVEDTLSLLAPLAYEKNLELINIVYHDVPSRLRGDPVRVQQILTNLLSNAIKFTAQGQVMLRVICEQDGASEDIWLRFQVEDSGIGMTTEQREKLFTAFTRFGESQLPSVQGSGLGLTIVQKLTDLMGGEISVESAPGEGSTFSVLLPFHPPQHAQLRPTWDALRGCRCWVLEPHSGASLALLHLLEFWGMEVRRFETGSDLNRALLHGQKGKRPQLVLLGVRSDELGEPLLAETLQLKLDEAIPICCLVNSVDPGIHRQLLDMGADTVLPKVATRTSLYRGCYELLGKSAPDRDQSQILAGRDVLIAENNLASQRFLRALLESLGARTLCVDDGQEAVTLWRSQRPRFVLLDLHMPELDGRQAAAAIREEDRSGRSVLIGMSAYLNHSEEQDWLDAGINTILIKPFDEAQLLRCLHPWLDDHPAELPAQDPTQARPSSAQRLIQDPELALMIVEELPKQLDELDDAFIRGELDAARNAAHQLHGTAAFFHLSPLKDYALLMEKRLKETDSITNQPRLRDDMRNVREAAQTVVGMIENPGELK